MSLLMQALQKAERAKQRLLQDDELAKPSEEFDDVLSLAPQEPAPPARSAEPDPEHGLSLAPLDDTPQLTPSLQPLDFIDSPADGPAPDAHAAAPAAARPGPRNTAPAKVKPGVAARFAAPGAIRLAILGGLALLVSSVLAYMYWQAVSSPGAGGTLPMVPMPALELNAAAALAPAAPAVAAGATGAAAPAFDGGASAAPAGPAPQAAFPEPVLQEPVRPIPPAATPARPGRGSVAEPERGIERGPERARPAQTPARPADGKDIRVLRTHSQQKVNPALQDGYLAFNSGDLAAARQQYESALRQDPNSRDALLGMAALALRQNQPDQAAALYLRVLELDPDEADALAGLIGLRPGDPVQSETRLKAVLQRSPGSGPALFALGNLYAQQKRWPEAQQSFFKAYASTPDNADYAFNLAVGLDRLNQGKLALTYYQRALALAATRPGRFDPAAVRLRLRELESGAAPSAP